MKKQMIVSFVHNNYSIKSAGTEKFVRTLSQVVQKQGYSHLSFFAFFSDHAVVGVNYNDKFIGLYSYSSIVSIISYWLIKEKAELNAIHFQHILNHDLVKLQEVIDAFDASLYFMLHDYYLICNRLNLIDSNGNSCGFGIPSKDKCKACKNIKDGIDHFEKMSEFLSKNEKRIKYLVAPSRYVATGFMKTYPSLKQKIVVRPHLQVTGNQELHLLDEKIKLAYVGSQNDNKGYPYWKEMVSKILKNCADNYELFYLGTGKDEIDGVKKVYVSISEQGENAMVDALKANEITCAFIWPQSAETYSYVYYELLISGVYIISNSISGNICDEIINRNNGVVFDGFEAAVNWVCSPQKVEKCINEYRTSDVEKPSSYRTNDCLELFVDNDGIDVQITDNTSKPRCLLVKTIAYKALYGKYRL